MVVVIFVLFILNKCYFFIRLFLKSHAHCTETKKAGNPMSGGGKKKRNISVIHSRAQLCVSLCMCIKMISG